MSGWGTADEMEFFEKSVDLRLRTGIVLMQAGSLKMRFTTKGNARIKELLSGFDDNTKVLLADGKAREKPEYSAIIKEFESLGLMLVVIPFK